MRHASFELPSFAKINWFLKVFGKRGDGFHEICTAFQTISLHDTIGFESAPDLTVSSSDPALPSGEGNLAFEAISLLRAKTGCDRGANISIEKRIPFPGGLGGGSSNAATALLGYCLLCGIEPVDGMLVEIASELGSDVPFFLVGGTALGTGRGTDIEPLPDSPPRPLLVCTPDIDVPTPKAYELLGRDRLTSGSAETNLIVCRELADKPVSGKQGLVNDFEEAVYKLAPQTRVLREKLEESGALEARLSGSGASVFGIFDNDEERRRARSGLSEFDGLRVSSAETISRPEFRNALGPCGDLLPKDFN